MGIQQPVNLQRIFAGPQRLVAHAVKSEEPVRVFRSSLSIVIILLVLPSIVETSLGPAYK